MLKGLENKAVNKRVQIKLNTSLRGYPPGTKMKILVDSKGIPFERYWRDRLKEAEVDNCIELL